MRLHLLVEGPSEEAFLNVWLPRFLKSGHTFKVIPHQGKGKLSKEPSSKPDPKRRGLLDQLPAKLRAYGKILNSDTDRVVVLVDADDENCASLLTRINAVIHGCNPAPTALVRIAIEETEAFFLGDARALKAAYPGAKIAKLRQHAFDSICGTWEKLQQVISGDDSSEDKVAWAEQIGMHLGIKWEGTREVDPIRWARNRPFSVSFSGTSHRPRGVVSREPPPILKGSDGA